MESLCNSCKRKEYCPRWPKANIKECDHYDDERKYDTNKRQV